MNGSTVRQGKIDIKETFELTTWSNPFPIWWRRWGEGKIFTWMVKCNRRGRKMAIIFSTFGHIAPYIIFQLYFCSWPKKIKLLTKFPICIGISFMVMLSNAYTISFWCIFIEKQKKNSDWNTRVKNKEWKPIKVTMYGIPDPIQRIQSKKKRMIRSIPCNSIYTPIILGEQKHLWS